MYALNKGLVDEVIVALPDEKDPMRARAIVTSDIGTIREAKGSKYTQIYMVDAIKRIIDCRDKRFAFVGLPCHIRALRNIEQALKLQNIMIRLGLYCGNLPSAWASEYLMYLYGIPKDRIKRLSYRGLGWPGYLTIELVNGKKFRVPEPLYWRSGFGQYFCDKCCIFCSDHTAELADVSFADPWSVDVKEVSNDRIGHTLVVVRSKVGLELLKAAERDGYVTLRKVSDKYAVQGTTVLKKVNKDQPMIYKLLKTHQKLKYEYTLPYEFPILVWVIDYIVGHALAMNKKSWIFVRMWRRLAETTYLLMKIFSKLLQQNPISGSHKRA